MFVARLFGCGPEERQPPARRSRGAPPRRRSPAGSAAAFGRAFAVILAAAALPAGTASAQRQTSPDLAVLHDRCVSFVEAHPQEGLERAKLWAAQGGGFYAEHCVAMALFALHDYAAAADRFQTLATAMLGMPAVERAQALDQAGQAWLDALRPDRAKAAFDAAIQLDGESADLLIDRSEAYAGMKQWWDALDDLNRAIDLSPDRADAYIYRAAAYRAVNALDLALQDVQHGLSLAPDSPTGLLERGIIRGLKGDAAGAREDWQRVRLLAPDTTQAKAATEELAKLDAKGEATAAKEPAKPKMMKAN